MSRTLRVAVACITAILAGCGGEPPPDASTAPGATAGPSTPAPSAGPAAQADARPPLVVAAGLVALAPSEVDGIDPALDVGPLGGAPVDDVYEVSTPPDEPFALNVLTRARGSAGATRLSIVHLADGGAVPARPMSEVALFVSPPPRASGRWRVVESDGFARLTLSGRITRQQVLGLRAETGAGVRTALLRIRIGARTAMAITRGAGGPAPFLLGKVRTLLTSDSPACGVPALAAARGRLTLVAHDGTPGGEVERCLGYDLASGATRSDTWPAPGADAAWRDHDLAAHDDVLVLARSEAGGLCARVSCDGGATFSPGATIDAGAGRLLPRVALGPDGALAVVCWAAQGDALELRLVLGSPLRGSGGAVTGYAFGPARTLHASGAPNALPFVSGLAWSEAGDLVAAYGLTWVEPLGHGLQRTVTRFRCATCLAGDTAFTDAPVEESAVEGVDPGVALRGHGASLEVTVAYEAEDGVRLRVSRDAGRSFGPPRTIGQPGALCPCVLARAGTLDVLYLQVAETGVELRDHRFAPDDGTSPGVDHLIEGTTSRSVPGGVELTSVGWLGLDAEVEGDDVHVVFDTVSCLADDPATQHHALRLARLD